MRPQRRRPPTSRDVAHRAGVSRATVSYVLNDVPDSRISQTTRERVREAAQKLGYIPHAMARSLRIGRSDLVLIARPAVPSGPLLDLFQESMETRLRELGYTVIMHGDRSVRGVAGARAWAAVRPVGVIVETTRLTRPSLRVLRTAGTRAVLGLGWSPSDLVPTLVIDQADIGRCAAEYLASKGHRRIAVVVPRDPSLLEMGLLRLAGIREAAERRAVEVERVDLAYEEADAAALAARWARGPRPSAAFTYNDEYGMLLQQAALDAGLAVPGTLALVGADDLPLCELLRPRLTSVHMEAKSLARTVAETLHAMVQGDRPDVRSMRPTRAWIVERESA